MFLTQASGGAIYGKGVKQVELIGCSVSDNQAGVGSWWPDKTIYFSRSDGGGLYFSETQRIVLQGCTVSNNQVTQVCPMHMEK